MRFAGGGGVPKARKAGCPGIQEVERRLPQGGLPDQAYPHLGFSPVTDLRLQTPGTVREYVCIVINLQLGGICYSNHRKLIHLAYCVFYMYIYLSSSP